ncbi:MAG: endonuclease/exonuclease/phosphatase family protein [Paramuribaculum sp.]|nr:endonuclease/exonuclease/phosphatase family protein [Paramuribaculum sp.]
MTITRPSRSTAIGRAASGAGILANIVVGLITIASAYGGIIDPNRTAIPALLAMLFPALLVLTLLLTAINCIWWRRRALIGAATLLICAGPILTYCPLNFFRPSEASIAERGDRVLKVMTFNVLGFHDISGNLADSTSINPTIRFILDNDPDIAICQEATPLFGEFFSPLVSADTLAIAAQYPYRYTSRRGMALLSKYPFERVEVPVADENAYDVCRYDVDVEGIALHIFNVHLQSIGLTGEDKAVYRNMTHGDAPGGGIGELRRGIFRKLGAAFRARAEQAVEIRRALDDTAGNIILAGDFNDIPGCYASRVIGGSDLTDAYSHAGLGPAITYHADRLFFRIDQIFYRGDIDALRVDALSCPWSDHYPLIAYFLITDNSKQ